MLKKSQNSDRVALVDCHSGLIAPFLAKLLNALTSRRFVPAALAPTSPVSYTSVLSPAEVRILERIVAEWYPLGCVRSQNVHQIIEMALLQLQRELDSGHEDEITEDLRREVEYRLWCARCR